MTARPAFTVSPDQAWDRALDEYDETLERYRQLLAAVGYVDADELVVPEFIPPAGLTHLPPRLLDRARAAALATEELVQQARLVLDRTRVEQASSRPARIRVDVPALDVPASFDRTM